MRSGCPSCNYFRTYLSGDRDVHWGYGILSYGHCRKVFCFCLALAQGYPWQVAGWLVGWLLNWLVGWLVGGWLAGWLVGLVWLAGWLVGGSVGQRFGMGSGWV